MKKTIAMLLAAAMSLSLVACGGGSSSAPAASSKPSAGTSTPASPSVQELSVCLASEPDTLDPALNSSVDGATMVSHLFSGLAKWAQDESGVLVIVADSAEELVEGVVNADGTVTKVHSRG